MIQKHLVRGHTAQIGHNKTKLERKTGKYRAERRDAQKHRKGGV